MISGAITDRASEAGIRLEVQGRCGRILLDRPRSMNALDLAMVQAFREVLEEFAAHDGISTIAVASTRPGIFCAGGDVRQIRQLQLDGKHDQAEAFFQHEFALNLRIAELPKPYVALIDGLCLGGGMGLSVHGSHPIAGPLAQLAMPETAIGYFPDVGASFFLNRMPRHQARFFALTGIRATPMDALAVGLVRAIADADALVGIQASLADGVHPDDALSRYAALPSASRVIAADAMIQRCFNLDSSDAMIEALGREDDPLADEALEALRAASPASLAITLDLLNRTESKPLGQCLKIEYALACEVTRGLEFAEGVRAMLVDKDKSPAWPSRA